MKNLKSNLEFASLILTFALIPILFFSLFVQIPVLANVIEYEVELANIEQLTTNEEDEICLGEPCNYSSKINFDHHIIFIASSSFQFSKSVWVYYQIIETKKVFVDYSFFLWSYLYFDITACIYLITFYFYMKGEKRKESINNPKKDEDVKLSVPKNAEEKVEAVLLPSDSFRFVFLLGFLQFFVCGIAAYFLAKISSHSHWIFLISFLLPFLTGIALYFSVKKSMAFLLSSLLCLAPAATGKDILYIDHLLFPNDVNHEMKEKVYNLEEGLINKNFTGAYVSLISSGSKSKSKTYTYHFVAPYQTKGEPYVQWIVLKQEWMEDQTKFDLFWQAWKQERLAVQIYDEDYMYAIQKAGERYQLDLSSGVALLKPILSVGAEISGTIGKVLWTNGIALIVWISIGLIRIYLR